MRKHLKRIVFKGVILVWTRLKPALITLAFLYISAIAQSKLEMPVQSGLCSLRPAYFAGIVQGMGDFQNKMVNISGRQLELTTHALLRMEQRHISVSEIQKAGRSGQLFAYLHNGIVKIGYYDVFNKIFVAVDRRHQKIITVIRGVEKAYIAKWLS